MDFGLDNASELIRTSMFVLLALFAAIFLILGAVMKYHWTRYGVPGPRHRLFWTIYFIGGLVLLAAMAASAIIYAP